MTDQIIASIYTFSVELPRKQVQGREPCALRGNTSKEKAAGELDSFVLALGGVLNGSLFATNRPALLRMLLFCR